MIGIMSQPIDLIDELVKIQCKNHNNYTLRWPSLGG